MKISSDKGKRYKRRNYLIRNSFQLRYAAMVIVLMVIITVSVGATIYLVTWDRLINELGATELGSRMDEIFTSLNNTLFWRVLLITVAGICMSYLIVIVVSHRIAGPFVRADKVAELIGDGIIPMPVKLREKDETPVLARSLNEIIGKLGRMQRHNLKILDSCRVELREVSEALSKENVPDDLKKKLDGLAALLEDLEYFAPE